MKILYAIQGTGNGHICRALDIIPVLQKKAEVDILISGTQADIAIPYLIKYQFKGISFIFGKKGGVDLWKTLVKNHLKKFISDVRKLPVENYDLIINDFEPVSAWACFLKGKACFALSHQSAVLDKNAPKPKKKDLIGRFILKNYAPAKLSYGFHFNKFNKNIFTPVIRKQIRDLNVSVSNHYTVYLPSYSDKKLIKVLGQFPDIEWQIFSKHNKEEMRKGNIKIYPISNKNFLRSLASCKGTICGAGFETPAEVLFLKKKLLVVPMKNQYEQHCNAAALKELGIPVLENFKKKQFSEIEKWLKSKQVIEIDYQDNTKEIIDLLLETYKVNYSSYNYAIPSREVDLEAF